MGNQSDLNTRPQPDAVITQIVDYVIDYQPSEKALNAAELCLMDSVGCALMALSYPACSKHLGPFVPGGEIQNGARVIGTAYQLDPIKATFDNGALIRWLDFNDTWLAAEWGHPSDNLASILSVSDYLSRSQPDCFNFKVADLLVAMVKAHEIQGILALENSLNRVGLDHVAYVKIASAAVSAHLLGATREQMIAAVSHALIDGQSLRTYRHAPNTCSRKSWAAGDAASRAVRLAMIAKLGEVSIPAALSAKNWGFYDVLFGGNNFQINLPFASYVMENILFKVSFPAEFHAQTAVECAIKLYPQVTHRLEEIQSIRIQTQESAVRIISKTGPLYNAADRDHCLQYMVAIPLIFGTLTAKHYEDKVSCDPRIDQLRSKMDVTELPRYSQDYLDPDKRSIANAIQIFFNDGSSTERVEIEYPLGHRRRREESISHLQEKFTQALQSQFDSQRCNTIAALFENREKLKATSVTEFLDLLTIPS